MYTRFGRRGIRRHTAVNSGPHIRCGPRLAIAAIARIPDRRRGSEQPGQQGSRRLPREVVPVVVEVEVAVPRSMPAWW